MRVEYVATGLPGYVEFKRRTIKKNGTDEAWEAQLCKYELKVWNRLHSIIRIVYDVYYFQMQVIKIVAPEIELTLAYYALSGSAALRF